MLHPSLSAGQAEKENELYKTIYICILQHACLDTTLVWP
jgi:hypothetical protein